ncbi:MAG: histidinol-phosphatase [Bacilli bacterium]|nr:histidinol-phosphatase [Bacilli bacterium]
MNKVNYHTHTYLCKHAIGTPIDYVKKAVENHYKEIGISDHGPLVPGWDLRMTLNEFHDFYLKSIEYAQMQYQGQIKVYKGLELEYLKEYDTFYQMLLEHLDYIILGQHVCYIKDKLHDIYSFMTPEAVISYKDLVVAGMESKHFRILAHPDVFMYKYKKWDDLAIEISKDIIESAIKNNVLLELNVNGIRRGTIMNQDQEQTYIYPRIEFWRLVSQYRDAKVIIGEDNHDPKLTNDEACEIARKMAQRLGIKPVQSLFEE